MDKKIKTTVIGSYPVNIDNYQIMKSYFDQNIFSWNNYILRAVNDMIKAGIDIVSDGQTRDPFVNIFIRKLKGCRIRDRSEIIDKVEFNTPITIDDQRFVRNNLPENKQLIGLITGPYTLTKSCVDYFYNDEKQLSFDFAKALNNEALELQKYVDIISIDEPFFSIHMPEYSKDLIETLIKNIRVPVRLHACGDVSKIISDLIELPVDILSHEFKASPEIFKSFQEHETDKRICLGSVRSDNPKIESVDEIVNHIRYGIEVFGSKISQISPDCGLRLMPRDVAFQKLQNLVIAGEKVYG